jgi:hypothetical protein
MQQHRRTSTEGRPSARGKVMYDVLFCLFYLLFVVYFTNNVLRRLFLAQGKR